VELWREKDRDISRRRPGASSRWKGRSREISCPAAIRRGWRVAEGLLAHAHLEDGNVIGAGGVGRRASLDVAAGSVDVAVRERVVQDVLVGGAHSEQTAEFDEAVLTGLDLASVVGGAGSAAGVVEGGGVTLGVVRAGLGVEHEGRVAQHVDRGFGDVAEGVRGDVRRGEAVALGELALGVHEVLAPERDATFDGRPFENVAFAERDGVLAGGGRRGVVGEDEVVSDVADAEDRQDREHKSGDANRTLTRGVATGHGDAPFWNVCLGWWMYRRRVRAITRYLVFGTRPSAK